MRAFVLLLVSTVAQTLGFQVLVQAPARRGGAAGLVSPSLAPAATTLRAPRRSPLYELKAAATVDVEDAATDNGLLDRERYVVFNRFQSRDGAGPRFEKRWADRKSSLKVLDGFRFFTLLRRADDVQLNDRPVEYAQGTADYMSMTVWETKKNFNSWRTGYAFKEAHGGGSIAGFLSAVVGSMMVIKSTPIPAMWDALCTITTATGNCQLELKNRDASGLAVTDGSKPLPAECFVAMNRFPVKAECWRAFEQRWANRESKLQGQKGFVGFMLMRRDRPVAGSKEAKRGGGTAALPDDIYSYSTCTIWASRQDWAAWRDGEGKTSHAAQAERVAAGADNSVGELLAGNPSPIFWEGVLALQSEAGF